MPTENATDKMRTERVQTEVIRTDPFTGQMNTMLITLNQYDLGIYEMGLGPLLQDAFPYLNAGDREFIKTGITPDAWDKMFGGSEE